MNEKETAEKKKMIEKKRQPGRKKPADRKQLALQVCDELNKEYGTDLTCYLDFDYEKPWQLLFATIMSAQCTDARVNQVTKVLYGKYPELADFAAMDIETLEKEIYSTGFYHNKAKNIIACARVLIDEYGGELPTDIDELVILPGVGRKTANVVRSHVFGQDSIVVDTHVKRVSKLLGLTDQDDPVKIEYELMEILPREQWSLFNYQVIAHGRNVCIARHPRCSECVMSCVCRDYLSRSKNE